MTMTDRPMLRALVAYESLFGNTERVARAVAAGLRLEGVDATVVDVSRAGPVDLALIDLLVVGAPTHGLLDEPTGEPTRRRAPRGPPGRGGDRCVREWLHAVDQSGHRVLAATFDTRVTKVRYLPASASRRAARELVGQGHTMVGAPMGFLVHGVSGPLEPREMDRAIAWLRSVATEAQSRMATTVTAARTGGRVRGRPQGGLRSLYQVTRGPPPRRSLGAVWR